MATITVQSDKGEIIRVTAMVQRQGLTTPVELGMVPAGEKAEFVLEPETRYVTQVFAEDWQARAEQAASDAAKVIKSEHVARMERLGVKIEKLVAKETV